MQMNDWHKSVICDIYITDRYIIFYVDMRQYVLLLLTPLYYYLFDIFAFRHFPTLREGVQSLHFQFIYYCNIVLRVFVSNPVRVGACARVCFSLVNLAGNMNDEIMH